MGLFKSKFKDELRQIREDIERKKDELKPEVFISVPLVGGLPLSENTLCQIYYCSDKIVIDGNNTNFVLSLDKVQDISIKRDVEIQKHFVSSAGGAVAGAIMFGPAGAMIGGRTKTKTTRIATSFLIITYEKQQGEVEYIAFDVTHTPKSHELVDSFNKADKKEKVIIL